MAAASPPPDRRRRRGPTPLPAEARRTHCVSVRLSAAELATLDGRRGPHQRGEWLRLAALDRVPPPPPPELNRAAWVELARVGANLNQLARRLNTAAVAAAEVAEARRLLAELRAALIGARQALDDAAEDGP